MNIQTQKAMIIEQFKQVEDENLIYATKNLLDNATIKDKKKFVNSRIRSKIGYGTI